MAAKTLTFWFHFFCPYSYLAWEALKRTSKGREVVIEPVPLEFDGIQNFTVKGLANFSDQRFERVSRRGKSLQLTINRPGLDSFSCVSIARGAKGFSGEALEKYIDAVFQAIFTKNLDPKDLPALLAFFQEQNIETRLFQNAINDPGTLAQLEKDIGSWREKTHQLLPLLEFYEESCAGFLDQKAIEKFFSALPL